MRVRVMHGHVSQVSEASVADGKMHLVQRNLPQTWLKEASCSHMVGRPGITASKLILSPRLLLEGVKQSADNPGQRMGETTVTRHAAGWFPWLMRECGPVRGWPWYGGVGLAWLEICLFGRRGTAWASRAKQRMACLVRFDTGRRLLCWVVVRVGSL